MKFKTSLLVGTLFLPLLLGRYITNILTCVLVESLKGEKITEEFIL
jgi:hypothetical protein